MPHSISQRHDLFIQRFVEEGTSKVLRTYRTVLAKDHQGFIFKATLYLNYFFEMQGDLLFSALIMKNPQANKSY